MDHDDDDNNDYEQEELLAADTGAATTKETVSRRFLLISSLDILKFNSRAMCLLQTPSTFLVATIIASVGPLLTRGEYVDANPIARKDFQEFPLKATGRLCEGGHRCSAPKECCALGCCYLYAPPSPPKTPASPVTDHVLNLFLVNHWYFW